MNIFVTGGAFPTPPIPMVDQGMSEWIFNRYSRAWLSVSLLRYFSLVGVRDYFEAANAVKVFYEVVGRRPGDIAVCYANAAKAEEELNWTAKRGLIEICRDALRFASRSIDE